MFYKIAPISLNIIFILIALCLALFAAHDLLLAGFVALTGCLTILYHYLSGGRARKNLAKLENLRKSLKSNFSIGETIIVPSGERIPADGVILEGEAVLNEFPLTGSPQQIMKRKDDWAYAATINEDGDLKIGVKQTGEKTMIAKVIGMVRLAAKSPSAFQKKATLTAVVFGTVLLSAGAAYYWKVGNINMLIAMLLVFFLDRAVFFSGKVWEARVSRLALHGAIVKETDTLEKMSSISRAVFDLDGYFSRSGKNFSYMRSFWGASDNDILSLASSAMWYSDYYLAGVILAEAHRKDIKYKKPETFSVIKGEGAAAMVDGVRIAVGSEKFIAASNIHIQDEIKKHIDEEKQKGMETALVVRDSKIIGALSFSDAKKAELKTAISQLENLGVYPVREKSPQATEVAPVDAAFSNGIKESVDENSMRPALIVKDALDGAAGFKKDVWVAVGTLDAGVFMEEADILFMSDSFGALQKMIASGRETAATLKIMFIALFGLSALGALLVWVGFFGPYSAVLFHIIIEFFVFIFTFQIAKKDGMV